VGELGIARVLVAQRLKLIDQREQNLARDRSARLVEGFNHMSKLRIVERELFRVEQNGGGGKRVDLGEELGREAEDVIYLEQRDEARSDGLEELRRAALCIEGVADAEHSVPAEVLVVAGEDAGDGLDAVGLGEFGEIRRAVLAQAGFRMGEQVEEGRRGVGRAGFDQ
jgi:hypothetical protein